MTWAIEHDVLTRTTRAVIDHGGSYPTPYGGFQEHYSGRVEVDRRTFRQRATARVSFALDTSAGSVLVGSDLEVIADEENFSVRIDLDASRERRADPASAAGRASIRATWPDPPVWSRRE